MRGNPHSDQEILASNKQVAGLQREHLERLDVLRREHIDGCNGAETEKFAMQRRSWRWHLMTACNRRSTGPRSSSRGPKGKRARSSGRSRSPHRTMRDEEEETLPFRGKFGHRRCRVHAQVVRRAEKASKRMCFGFVLH